MRFKGLMVRLGVHIIALTGLVVKGLSSEF